MKIKSIFVLILIVSLANNIAFAQGGLRNFFSKVSMPFRTAWGEYSEPGQTPYPPLTTFYNKSKRDEIMIDVKYNIKYDINNFDRFYAFKIVAIANKSKLGKQEVWKGVYENAEIAKCAAFVLVLGVYENGSRISKDTLDILAANVLTVIKECDDNITDNWFQKEGLTGWGEDAQMIRSIELINYCIALDMVSTPGYMYTNGANIFQ